mmetsp:Transcript_14981/g.32953  ORF Transcript_14981/g.32953 Transcript_14981/m.32953 type:complete len:287 (-) Transcript_14981:46-906(-)
MQHLLLRFVKRWHLPLGKVCQRMPEVVPMLALAPHRLPIGWQRRWGWLCRGRRLLRAASLACEGSIVTGTLLWVIHCAVIRRSPAGLLLWLSLLPSQGCEYLLLLPRITVAGALEPLLLLVPFPELAANPGPIRLLLKNAVVFLTAEGTLVDVVARFLQPPVASVALSVVQRHANARAPDDIVFVVDNHIHGHPLWYLDLLVVVRQPEDQPGLPSALNVMDLLHLKVGERTTLAVKLKHRGEVILEAVAAQRRGLWGGLGSGLLRLRGRTHGRLSASTRQPKPWAT